MSKIFSIIKENSRRYPGKTAIVEINGKTLTYSQLIRLVEARINQLRPLIKPGQTRVALCIPEGIEIPINVLALNSMNVPVIPVNPALQVDQLIQLLDSVDAELLITDSVKARPFDVAEVGFKIVVLDKLDPTVIKEKVLYVGSVKPVRYDEFLITLSSGSTGRPKPIVFSEKNKLDRFGQAVRLYNVNSEDVILCASPFFHSLGQRLTFLPLLAGATLVQLPRFTVQNWCDAVASNGVTFTIPVSSHLHELVDILLASAQKLSSLRCLVSSSAAIDEEVKDKLFTELQFDFHEMYGTSEIATATNLNGGQAASKPKSVGFPCSGVDVQVVDENLALCSPLEMGQIIVKSTLAFAGYYKLPKTAEESFVDGYFLTGDLGYLDDDGYLYFVDRKKDVIISGGMNIYPSDIEAVINEHLQVKDCAVVGIHDRYLGEVPVAVIVSDGDDRSVTREIQTLLRQRLAAYQRPMKCFFKEHLPLTTSGKVDKVCLRKELNALKLDLSANLRALQKT